MAFSTKLLSACAIGAMAIAVAACGGSGESSSAEKADATPAEKVEAAKDAMTETAAATAEKVENAAAATQAAATETAEKTSNAMADAGEAAKGMADKAVETASGAADAMKTAAGDAADGAAGVVENAKAMAGDAMEATKAAAGEAVNSAFANLTGDATAGKRVFAKCMACHTVAEGQNRVGPSLYGVVGRDAGTVAGFNYSDANANSGITWTEGVLFAYLENPQEYIPGTRMIFPGLPSEQDRADVIAYLKSVTN